MQDATHIRMESRTARRTLCAYATARLMWSAALVCVLAVCAAHADSPAVPADEAVVRVYPNAVVGGDEVALSDIAEVTGEAAKLISGWPVATAPPPGGSRGIDLTRVQELLARRGVNLSRWIFRGATRCTVTRPKSMAAGATAHSSAGNVQRPNSATALPLLGDSTGATTTVDPNSLEAFIRAHLTRRLANLGGTPVIQFNPAVRKLLSLSQPTYRFRISDCGDRLLGLVSLEVTIFERDAVKQVLPVLVQISLRKRVVAAARSINRSETIESDDLSLIERTFDRIDAIGLTDMAPLIGQRAKRFIKCGDLVSARDIEPVPLVTRGRLVTVWVRRGGVVIKGAATAMSTAGFGEPVLLRNAGSRQTFRAIVTGRDTAEVPGPESEPVNTVALAKEKR